jgi:hypothetical protein
MRSSRVSPDFVIESRTQDTSAASVFSEHSFESGFEAHSLLPRSGEPEFLFRLNRCEAEISI